MERAPALYIDGEWTQGLTGVTGDSVNPATGRVIGTFPHAKGPDIERALAAAQAGFKVWSRTPAIERSAILRKASELMRQRAQGIGELMTLEQGKPLAEARGEAMLAPEHTEWCAEEGRRLYGRVVPARSPSVRHTVLREPVGPVAAFAPWNFPVNQSIRKIAGALAAGCSIILKGPEEAPSCTTELVRCFHDAGLPKGVLNLLFGVPSEISEPLIASPIIRKVSFTGSVSVGKHLAALSGRYMKRTTMELGGHAPVLVFKDTDPVKAAEASAAMKFRNAGQSCISPSRFFVQEDGHDAFVQRFAEIARALKVGDGMDPATQMGPLAASRRIDVMEEFVSDASARGAVIEAGGKRVGNEGFFFAPTVLRDVPDDARILQEEPFGPLAPIVRFKTYEDAVEKANGLELGLAAYAFTGSADQAARLTEDLQAGLVSINGAPLTAPETPFGGVKDSGYGSEGGIEGMEPFLITKLASQAFA
jgi:succinate-semialdehyde dehydrogenase/glutarate-semialdehyde dehydrogenase